jgi:hypothetical protein
LSHANPSSVTSLKGRWPHFSEKLSVSFIHNGAYIYSQLGSSPSQFGFNANHTRIWGRAGSIFTRTRGLLKPSQNKSGTSTVQDALPSPAVWS